MRALRLTRSDRFRSLSLTVLMLSSISFIICRSLASLPARATKLRPSLLVPCVIRDSPMALAGRLSSRSMPHEGSRYAVLSNTSMITQGYSIIMCLFKRECRVTKNRETVEESIAVGIMDIDMIERRLKVRPKLALCPCLHISPQTVRAGGDAPGARRGAARRQRQVPPWKRVITCGFLMRNYPGGRGFCDASRSGQGQGQRSPSLSMTLSRT